MKLFGKWQREEPPTGNDIPAFVADAANTPTPVIGKNRTILVVDDNPVVLKAFELKLQAGGFDVLTATEGAAAVSLARQTKPDIIVLDINFPPDVGNSGLQWDGFNIVQWLRRFQDAANIPVIIVSSGEPAKYKEKSLAAGAIAFFQKPIKYAEFMDTITKALPPKA
jgi:two-component system, cell cycle response regulator DivK